MSDTEDTEELIKTNSISSKKKNIIIEDTIYKEELLKIGTIELISDLLVKICEENKTKICNKNILLKSFTNKNIPSISIKDYLLRLSKHTKVNESTIILILIYIDRICNMNHFILTYYNIHKLILAALILAIKYNEENYYHMIYYSKIGGVSLSELNFLESEYLILIGYKLFVDTKLYDKYYNDLMSLKYDDSDDGDNDEEYEEQEQEQEQEEDEKEEQIKEEQENDKINTKKNNKNNIYIDKSLFQKNPKSEKQNYYCNEINYQREIIQT